jgi:hypothetical protein
MTCWLPVHHFYHGQDQVHVYWLLRWKREFFEPNYNFLWDDVKVLKL